MNRRSHLSALVVCLCFSAPVAHAVICTANLQPSNPDADYTDHGDGTVTHVPTGLIWKRCSEGQTWTGNTCTGIAIRSTWAEALTLGSANGFAGKSDWRLPSIRELRSLVEECRTNPPINDTIFPATPTSDFWSSSPFANHSSYAWYVRFNTGSSNFTYRSSRNSMRLVRGGQPVASLAPPICTLNANLTSVAAGSASTLTANCSPAATSYVWTGGACAGTTAATCTVTPTATTMYTVAGVNAGGTGNAASATVTVMDRLATPTVTLTPNEPAPAGTKIKLFFPQVNGASSYELCVGNSPGNYDIGCIPVNPGDPGNTFTTQEGWNYYLAIRAVAGTNRSAFSTPIRLQSVTPSIGTWTSPQLGKDFDHTRISANQAPTYQLRIENESPLSPGAVVRLFANATDPDSSVLYYYWYTLGGEMRSLNAEMSSIEWRAPSNPGTYYIRGSVSDGNGGTASAYAIIVVR